MSTECFLWARHCAKRFTKDVPFKSEQYGTCALRSPNYKGGITGSGRLPNLSRVTSKCPHWELNPISLNFITLVFFVTLPDSAPMCTHCKLILSVCEREEVLTTDTRGPPQGTTTAAVWLATNTVSLALVRGKPQEPMGAWISAWP